MNGWERGGERNERGVVGRQTVDRWLDGLLPRWMDGWVEGSLVARVGGWMDRWMDG